MRFRRLDRRCRSVHSVAHAGLRYGYWRRAYVALSAARRGARGVSGRGSLVVGR
jgi:hypothetical protein